ncbi:MAG TPA: S8 family serine peptidase [Natronosporangium sp.]
MPVTVTTVAGQAAAQAGSPAGAPAGAATGLATGPRTTLTLLTGDRLTLAGDELLSVEPAPGRSDVTFAVSRLGDRLRVVPSDAEPLLAAGRLDPRLFDVSDLLAAGADRPDSLPLIVTGGSGAARVAGLATAEAGRELPSVGGAAVRVDPRDGSFWAGLLAGQRALVADRTTIWLDAVHQPTLDVSVPQIGAPTAWQAGYTGEGVTVAVVDTGIDETHPDLAGRVTAARDFTGTGSDDTQGHGTHVASTIAGSGAASGGRYQGVAPDAALLDAKVCIGRSCPESLIIAGIEWAAEQGAKVVNMSLSGPDTPELDPLEQAVDNLTASHGVLFVTAAGNEGDDETVGSPASADAALAVGAVTKSDQLADFSSRGPRVGDAAIKPDVTAPGQDIVAARSSTSGIGDPANPYATLSGTSMATPHVAGAAAILAQQSPTATPAQLKAVLMASAVPHPQLGAFAQGAGRIDLARAIEQRLTTDPPSVSFGRQEWPHEDDQPVVRTVTYRNHGETPVTVDLTLTVRAEDGTPAPAGMFTLSADTLTVPAGGEAQVTITADTSLEGPTGYLSGQLVATGDGVSAGTPVAVDREGLTHRLTAVATDRNGDPASAYNAYLVSLDEPVEYRLDSADGSRSVRVPPGRYAVVAHIFTGPPDGERSLTKLVQPELVVDGDLTVALDARLGAPIDVSVQRADAVVILQEVAAIITAAWGQTKYGILSFAESPMYSGQLGPDQPAAGFVSYYNTELLRPGPDGEWLDSPYYYHLTWYEPQRMLTGLSRNVRDQDLARVTGRYAGQGDGSVLGGKTTSFVLPGFGGGVAAVVPFRLPFQRTEFYTTDGDIQWQDNFLQIGESGSTDEITTTYAEPVSYQAGRRYTVTWNEAVFAPALPTVEQPRAGVLRSGDVIVVDLPIYGDQAGREGFAFSSTGRTELYREGALVGASDLAGRGVFEVPPEPANYRLVVTAQQDPRLSLSTSITAEWTFQSAHVEGGGGKDEKGGAAPQPLSAVRFMPAVSEHNTLPAGRAHVVPFEVYGQAGAPVAVDELTASVSTDGGASWQPARTVVFRSGTGLLFLPPGQPGYVSLRVSASGPTGTVDLTVANAWQLVSRP